MCVSFRSRRRKVIFNDTRGCKSNRHRKANINVNKHIKETYIEYGVQSGKRERKRKKRGWSYLNLVFGFPLLHAQKHKLICTNSHLYTQAYTREWSEAKHHAYFIRPVFYDIPIDSPISNSIYYSNYFYRNKFHKRNIHLRHWN